MRKVSFKISKNGTRYRPKPKPYPSVIVDNEVVDQQLIPANWVERDIDFSKNRLVVDLTEDDDDEDTDDIPDADVSFIVNIFSDGYTIDKSLKSNAAQQIASMYDPKLLRPYDRASQSLFTAIECCRVPANFFEDIPCTCKNGKVACEVRDWRKESSEQAGVSINGPPSIAATPSIRRISLRMSVDSIVRDIPQMSKRDFWAYSQLLEAEAKILLALYPKLDLDPYPNFDRLCKKPTTVKLDLNFRAMRRKRLRQMFVPEKSNLGTDQPNVANPATQNVGQRTVMGPPNSVNLATQNVRQLPTMDQLTQNVRQLRTMDQLTQNVRQIPAMDQPNSVNLAAQNVGQCNTTVPKPRNHAPNTSIPTFPWVSHQPEDQFGASGTAFNAPVASSTHSLVNLSSGNDGINSIMSAFEGGRGNQDRRQSSSSMANSDHRNRSNPLASSSALRASSTHAMQSASSNQDRQSSFMANSNNRNWSDPLALIGNHQQMTLEVLDNTPGTAFNALRASNTCSMSLPSANDSRRSFVSAFDGRTVNQDGQSSFPMAFLDGRRSRSDSLVLLGNQQQQLASHMQYNNAARNSVNAPGASSSHGMMNLNSNNGGTSLIFPFDGNKGNQDGHSSSLVKMENRNWSNPLAEVVNQHQLIPLHNQNTSGTTAFSAPEASSTHGSIIPFDDGKTGNQDGRSSFVGYQQPKIEPYMPDHSQPSAFGVPGASSMQSMIDLTSHNDDLSSILFGLNDKSGNQTSFPPQLTRSTFVQAPWNNKSPSPVIITIKEEPFDSSTSASSAKPGEFSSGSMEMQFRGVGSSRRRQKSVGTSVPAIGGRGPINIITIEDDEPVQRRSSSRPPKSGEFSSLATQRQYRAAARSSSQTERSVVNSVPAVVNSMHPTQMAATLGSSGIRSSSTIGNTSGLSIVSASVQRELDINIPSSVVQLSDGQHNRAIGPTVIAGKPYPVGTSNASRSSSTHKMWVNAEGGGFSVPSPSNPITDAINSLIQTSHSVDLSMQQQQSQRRQGNMMPPGNVVGTGRNIGGEISMVGGQGSGNVRRGVPHAGRRGASPLVIFDPNPMEINQGSTISTASIRRASILGRCRGQSSNAGGSQGGNLQVPSGAGSGSGSRGRGSRGRGSRGQGSRGQGSDITPDNHMNPRQRNGTGRQPRMALSKPSVLGEFGEQSRNTGVVRIGNMNIDSRLITGSGSGSGSGSHGLLVRSTSGISRASDMNRMQRNAMASPRSMSDMNRNQMQQQTNLHPASVSTSVNSGASRPSVSTATNQDGASSSMDWIDDEFMRNLMS